MIKETQLSREHAEYIKSITIKPMDWINQEVKKEEIKDVKE